MVTETAAGGLEELHRQICSRPGKGLGAKEKQTGARSHTREVNQSLGQRGPAPRTKASGAAAKALIERSRMEV